jgi:hypothetical protein
MMYFTTVMAAAKGHKWASAHYVVCLNEPLLCFTDIDFEKYPGRCEAGSSECRCFDLSRKSSQGKLKKKSNIKMGRKFGNRSAVQTGR